MRDNWIEIELQSLIAYVIGGDWGKDLSHEDDEYKVVYCIRGAEFKNWGVEKGSTAAQRKVMRTSIEKRRLYEGDILLEISGGGPEQPVGRTVLIENSVLSKLKKHDVVCTNFLRLLRPYNFLNSKWINTYLEFFYSAGKTIPYQAGSNNLRNLKYEQYKTVKVPLAPFPEQRAIVAKIEVLFSKLDNGIDNLNKAKEKLEIYRQAVLKKAFEGELTIEWREKQMDLISVEELQKQINAERNKYIQEQNEAWRNAVSEWDEKGKVGSKPSKPKLREFSSKLEDRDITDLARLPECWFYNYLAYAGDLGRGKSKHRPRNDERLFGGSYPFIQTAEVRAQDIITDYTQTYSEFGLAQSKLWPKGTLCITIAANIAETGFLGIDACFPDSVVGFTPFESIIEKRYIDYFLKFAKRKISAWAPATAQKNINLNILENIVMPFCSIDEQKQVVMEIEARLSVCDNIQANINDALNKAGALRQSLLMKAFEGKLLSESEIEACKKEPDWEPAEKLLEKIKK